MTKLPRRKCPYCGHKKAVRKDGTLYPHAKWKAQPPEKCPGSGARGS